MAVNANIAITKNDGTTAITFTAVQNSAGDGSPAVWKSQTVGAAQAHQPELRVTSRDSVKGQNRHIRATFKYPQIATNSTTAVTSVVNQASATMDWDFPKSMTQSDINEFASQLSKLLASTLIVQSVKDGFAPT